MRYKVTPVEMPCEIAVLCTGQQYQAPCVAPEAKTGELGELNRKPLAHGSWKLVVSRNRISNVDNGESDHRTGPSSVEEYI